MKHLLILLALVPAFSATVAQSPRRSENRYGRSRATRLEATLVNSNNAFAIKLFKQVDRKAGSANTFLSPYSITTALALLYNGAGGRTREAMGDALGFRGFSLEEINNTAAALRDVLEAPESGIKVKMANGVWMRRGRHFTDDFIINVARFFRADASEVEFGTPGAADEINDWVADRTQENIDYLFADEDISSAEAVLANAVWFKGRWQRAFDPNYTQKANFVSSNGETHKISMMRRTHAFPFFRANGVTGVAVPYGKGAFSFYAVMPNEGSSLKDLVSKLDPGRWYEWMQRFRADTDAVSLTLPKFKVTEESVLNEALSELGMGAAFSQRADYAPMGLYDATLRLIKHKAALEIAESGKPAPPMPVSKNTEVERIEINRPFLCAIRDNRTGAILFMGAIRNPA